MNESESKNEKPKGERRFDPELLKKGLKCDLDQYEFLKECSKEGEKGIKKWNEWRGNHEYEDVLLEGANFSEFYLQGVNLGVLQFIDCETNKKIFGEVYLKSSVFQKANLDFADLQHAHLEHAELQWASLSDATLMDTHLEHANLNFTHLEGADISGVYLQNTDLRSAHLDGCHSGYLPGQKLNINRHTDIRGVDLSLVWISPGTKQLLEYNIRRMNWEKWYKEQHWSLRWMVRKFWQISDYGISTKQIIKTFFKLAFVFAIIYYIWGFIDYYLVGIKDYPGIVSDLFVLEDYQEAVSCWLVPFRAVYFSVVTMTTLGFGDMYANAHSFLRGLFGHALLALQVILGYVLLGALVTRFAVLFTTGGPAGKFANEKEKKEG